ncbi:hypothetical protein OS965_02580 [Streptomyces sp. H27-G5]|uniref:hypothetical protein n=1 Tax=Streptomyces sp. H27-G5 TaxID=2996698 RepID=UPI0022702819|nr:hypothetical protein [Streptomyces sp. H27-G5]MCY0917063.1 hypothetical protein [Streptomyces sp. H27-G5]
MPNPKLSTLIDAFMAGALNTSVWNSITGSATLDTTADLVTLAHPTTSGATNSFGSATLYDATASSVYAQITAAPNGSGNTKTAMVLRVDANNSVAIRVESGTLKFTLQTAGTTTTTTLGSYDPHTHRWWQLREAAGTWYADTSADSETWTTQTSSAYPWAASAAAMTFSFQTSAGATEVAGMVASIGHINTSLGGPFNPGWPVIEEAWGPYWSASSDAPADRYTDVSPRTRGSSSINRGRQYELDTVRAGELSTALASTDGVIDPTNPSSPFAGRIAPYQPYRKRAQWPPTVNILSQAMATGGDLGGYAAGSSTSPAGVYSDQGSGVVTASGSAWLGATVMQFSVPSGTAAPGRACYAMQPAALPGQTYTMQIRVRNITPATSLQVKPGIGWYDAALGGAAVNYTYGSTVTLTGSATAAWTLCTVTVTAPANAAGINCAVAVAATAGATVSIQVDGWQLEAGSTTTPWVAPGVWYPMYAGYAERWSSDWRDGVYGIVSPTCVDPFALFSQVTLSDPLTQEINALSPRFLFKLDDPQDSLTASDSTGNYGQAELAVGKYGAGAATFGASITSTSAGGTYTGSSGTVLNFANPYPGQNLLSPATYLKLASAGITGPIDPTSFTRIVAFRYTGPLPATAAYIWSAMDRHLDTPSPGSRVHAHLTSAGIPLATVIGPTGVGLAYTAGGAVNCADGNWHLLLFGYNAATAQVICSLDGATSAYYGTVPAASTPTGIFADNLGCYVNASVGGGTTLNFAGEISFVAEVGWVSTAAQITGLYQAWKSSFSGESTSARYSRILGYAGWSGAKAIQTGLTTAMGAANFGGQDCLSALQSVVETEGGTHYTARDGTLTFRSRAARYNALTPEYVFGERADLGEYPYEECRLDFDPTRLSNKITVTQTSTSQTFTAQDATSIASYMPRPLTRNLNTQSGPECQDAANYLLSRYKEPVTRVTSLKLHPSAQPALWAVALALELGTRVRVMRRPPGVPAIQVDCFVESLKWDMDDRGEAYLTVQCSPVDVTPYGLFAAWHTTLRTTVASGVASISINPSQDNTNPLAAQLAVGTQIVLGQNTANQETVTIASVGATSAGWTSAVLTLTGVTTKAHTAGDLINEVLPAGTTDPTTWDAASAFDATAFAY